MTLANVQTGEPDVDRLLKLARRLEQDGRKTAAEITYQAASEIARIRMGVVADRDLSSTVAAALREEYRKYGTGENDDCVNLASAALSRLGQLGRLTPPMGRCCYECDEQLLGPFCPACNPEAATALGYVSDKVEHD